MPNALARPEQSDFSTTLARFTALSGFICGDGRPVYDALSLECRVELGLALNKLAVELTAARAEVRHD